MGLERNENTRKALLEQVQHYPELKIRDVFKYLYQSSFGCEHMVSSLDGAIDWIRKEYDSVSDGSAGDGTLDPLDGGYVRVHLDWLDRGLSAETLGKLFYLSAKTEEDGKNELERKLDVALDMTQKGELPFGFEEFRQEVDAWKAKGCPAVHHSEEFREIYHPAYRLVAEQYVKFLPLFCEIDR